MLNSKKYFFPLVFPNFSIHDCHSFFKKVSDLRKHEVKLDIIPQTNEYYKTVTYVGIRFVDSYRFLASSLDGINKTLQTNDLNILKEEFPINCRLLNKKLAYP